MQTPAFGCIGFVSCVCLLSLVCTLPFTGVAIGRLSLVLQCPRLCNGVRRRSPLAEVAITGWLCLIVPVVTEPIGYARQSNPEMCSRGLSLLRVGNSMSYTASLLFREVGDLFLIHSLECSHWDNAKHLLCVSAMLFS